MRQGVLRGVVMAVSLAAASAGPALGQRLLESCPECTIRFDPYVTIGDAAGLGALGQPGVALKRHNGEWIVTDYQDSGRLRLYSATGAFSRLLSRSGEGPSEFGFVFDMAEVAGDSVCFVDQGNARIAMRDEALRPVRTVKLPVPAGRTAFFQDGSLVTATGAWPGPEGLEPLAYVSARGEVLASFGDVPAGTGIRDMHRWWRSVVAASDSTVIAAGLMEYVLREWSIKGRLVRRFERDVEWFRPHGDFGPRGDHDEAPGPGIVALKRDDHGFVWVMILVPDPHWEEGVGLGRDPYGRGARVITDEDRYYDTVLEVIDPRAGRVLASRRVDQRLTDFAAPGVVYGATTTAGGIPVVRSWRVDLVR